MDKEKLQISQYVDKHPVLREKELYKIKYIRLIEYFVKRYSSNDEWANAVLDLYKRKLLDKSNEYSYIDDDLENMLKGVLVVFYRTGMRRYRLNRQRTKLSLKSFRYSLFIDILFICAFNNREKASIIFEDIKSIYGKTYCHKLDELFDCLYGDNMPAAKAYDYIGYMYSCWKKNKEFINQQDNAVLVVGNINSGKSLLLNALIGRKINKSQAKTCTTKVHYLYNKAFDDNLDYKWDHILKLEADSEFLLNYNEDNKLSDIYIGSRFRILNDKLKKICFIDTPGADISSGEGVGSISHRAIQNIKYKILIAVLDCDSMGSDSYGSLLQFIARNYDGRKVYFVINQIDKFREKEDSVNDTINRLAKDLKKIGFQNPVICPISAYAGYLGKMALYGEDLEEEEKDELSSLHRKLRKDKFRLDTYFPKEITDVLNVADDKNSQLLLYSGILPLEYLLDNK